MAEIFNIQHEVDLSEYNSTSTDSGDLSQAAGAALAGTAGGLSCLIDDTNNIYGEVDFTAITSLYYRFRFYIDINSLTMGDPNGFVCCDILHTNTNLIRVYLRYSSGYNMYVKVYEDDATQNNSSYQAVTDAEHYVEVLVVFSTGEATNDATVDWWIDGDHKEQMTGLDIYSRDKPDRGRLGAVAAIDAGTSGTFYLDEFIFRDDSTEIGEVLMGVPPLMNSYRRRRI